MLCGSGGGGWYNCGGSGGGAIRIACRNLIMMDNAIIQCDGEHGVDGSGSGSGGSIHLIVSGDIQLHQTAKIQAKGGESGNRSGSGNGGYGRIRIENPSFEITMRKKMHIEPPPFFG